MVSFFSFLSKIQINNLWVFSSFTNIYQSPRFCWRCGMKWKDIENFRFYLKWLQH